MFTTALMAQAQPPLEAYVFQGFGVFLGVLARTAVNMLVRWTSDRIEKGRRLKAVRFELEYNTRKLDDYLSALG